MKLKVPYNKLNMLSPEYNPTLAELADTADRLGSDGEADSDRSHVEYQIDNDKLPLHIADMLHANGVIITDFPLFIEIKSKTDVCPFMPEGAVENTWEDWKLDNHTFYEVGGKIFIGTNAGSNEDMDWADLAPVRDSLILPINLPVLE